MDELNLSHKQNNHRSGLFASPIVGGLIGKGLVSYSSSTSASRNTKQKTMLNAFSWSSCCSSLQITCCRRKWIPTQSSISEAEQAELEEFIQNAKILINTLGYKVFEAITEAEAKSDGDATEYSIAISGHNARGMPTSDGFVLFKGSTTHRNSTVKTWSPAF